MYGLILDTSSSCAILGLLDGKRVVKFSAIEGAKKLSETLFPALEEFCDIKDISYIAIGVGPGSYMGVRTGATIAKTLAFARNIPLVEFPSPLAFLPPGQTGSFAFLGDAKMGQSYLITGRAEYGVIHEISSPSLIDRGEIPPKSDFIVGGDHLPVEPNLFWVSLYVHDRYIKNNTISPNALALSYLRE